MFTFTSRSGGLRIYTTQGSVKFRGGQFTTESPALAKEIRTFGRNHPEYGVTEAGAGASETPALAPESSPPEVESLGGESGAEGDAEDDEYAALTVPELQELARQRGLAVGGNKAKLLERLRTPEEE